MEWSIHANIFSKIKNYFYCVFIVHLLTSSSYMLCRTRRFWNWYCFMQMGKWLFLLFLHFVLFKMFCEKIENELAEGIIILLLSTTQVWFMITIEDLKGSDIPEMLDIKFLVYVSIGKMKSLWTITLQNTTKRLFF